MTRDEAERAVAREREKQGLPPRIEDTTVLTRIATIMRLVGHELDVDQPRSKRQKQKQRR